MNHHLAPVCTVSIFPETLSSRVSLVPDNSNAPVCEHCALLLQSRHRVSFWLSMSLFFRTQQANDGIPKCLGPSDPTSQTGKIFDLKNQTLFGNSINLLGDPEKPF